VEGSTELFSAATFATPDTGTAAGFCFSTTTGCSPFAVGPVVFPVPLAAPTEGGCFATLGFFPFSSCSVNRVFLPSTPDPFAGREGTGFELGGTTFGAGAGVFDDFPADETAGSLFFTGCRVSGTAGFPAGLLTFLADCEEVGVREPPDFCDEPEGCPFPAGRTGLGEGFVDFFDDSAFGFTFLTLQLPLVELFGFLVG
jgi:hypothetical protein